MRRAPERAPKRVLVEVILDVSDPWSYVAWRRLEDTIRMVQSRRAHGAELRPGGPGSRGSGGGYGSRRSGGLGVFGDFGDFGGGKERKKGLPLGPRFDVQTRVLPCVLDPTLPAPDAMRWLRRLPTEPQRFTGELMRCARKVGLAGAKFRNNNVARRANTTQSHALLRYAERVASLATQAELLGRIFNSFLGDGPFPNEKALLEHAVAVGLDADAARAYMQSREANEAVRAESEDYIKRGVKQLPFLVMNGKAILAGFCKREVIEECFEKCPTQPPPEKVLD